MNMRERIIKEAIKQDPSIGYNAMITSGEWGYWIGSVYVSKRALIKETKKKEAAK